jgi:hypothetical protein
MMLVAGVRFGITEALACRTPAPPANCLADSDGDGFVGVMDFLDLLCQFGPCP